VLVVDIDVLAVAAADDDDGVDDEAE